MVNVLDFKEISSDKVIFIGDIHGDFELFLWRIKRDSKDFLNTIIILLGDCGIGFYKERYYQDLFDRMNKVLKTIGTTVIMFRGNHDDPSYYDGKRLNFSNLKVVPDYTVIKTKEKNILCIGGGLSVDRISRKQQEYKINRHKPKKNGQKLYWENEFPIYDEDKLNEIRDNSINIDVMASHTAPSFFPFKDDCYIKSYLSLDDKLKDDLIKERGIMDKIYEYVTVFLETRYWFYGHFHSYQRGKYGPITYQMMPNNDETKSFSKSLQELIDENIML